MTDEEIIDRLAKAALQRAAARNFSFGDGADQAIKHFAMDAPAKIRKRAEDTGESLESLIYAAEANFRALVDEMIRARDDIPGYATSYPQKIGEQTLAQAMNKLCPLWPIC